MEQDRSFSAVRFRRIRPGVGMGEGRDNGASQDILSSEF
jgi:hypothetical protein